MVAHRRPYIATHIRALFVVQGVVALLLGIGLFTVPVGTVMSVVTVLGGYWFIRGVANILYIVIESTDWGWKLFVGAPAVVAGILALVAPQVGATTFAVFVYIIAFQGIVTGVAEIYYGSARGRVGVVLLGMVSVVLGAMLVLTPEVGVATAAIVMGAVGLIGGLLTFVIALRGARTLRRSAA